MTELMTEQEAWNRVVAVVSSMTGLKPEQLTPATRVYHDLGISGDDVDDLEAIFEGVPVDWTGHNGDKYFPPEGRFQAEFPYWWKPTFYQPLYLSDLADILRYGKSALPERPVIIEEGRVLRSKMWSILWVVLITGYIVYSYAA